MQTLIQDLRYAVRMLLKNPGFTAIAVLTLGLGVGANTAIFNFTNALLFRPPAVGARDRLVEIWTRNTKARSAFEAYMTLSFPEYVYYRDHNQVFSDVMAFDADPGFINWNHAGQGQLAQGQFVSGNFFTGLGVKPALGRIFLPEEDKTPGTHPVVVLSHRFWTQQFGSDPNALGKSITLNGTSFTVVGVAPPEFNGMLVGMAPDFWMPIMMEPLIQHDPEMLERRGAHRFLGLGKLRPGVTRARAGADLSLLARQLERAYPDSNRNIDAAVFPATLVPGPFRGYVGAFTGLLQVVVAFVLLIACANAAHLFLAQSAARRHEMAIRSAIGASRWRLIRQTLTESLLISTLAGMAGFLLAQWATPFLLRFKPARIPIELNVAPDWRVFAFTMGLSLFAGIVFGLAPALKGSKFNLTPALKEGIQGGGRRRSRLQAGLLVAEVALCFVLLIGGGLCLRSLLNAQSIDPGFKVANRLVATLDLQSLNYAEDKGKRFYETLAGNIKNLPGVTSVTIASYLPLEPELSGLTINVEGRQPPPGEDGFGVQYFDVGPDFFSTMGTTLLRGRESQPAGPPRLAARGGDQRGHGESLLAK